MNTQINMQMEDIILAKFRQVDKQYGEGTTPLVVGDFRLCTALKDAQIRRVLNKMVKAGKLTVSKWDRRNAYMVSKLS